MELYTPSDIGFLYLKGEKGRCKMREKYVLIITHGKFGAELLKSVEMIIGEQDNVSALSLSPGEDVDELRNQAERIIIKNQSDNKDTIIFVDILGGSPSNVALYMVKKYKEVKLITGVNMFMLIEAFHSKEIYDIDELLIQVINTGIEGIQKLEYK